MAATREQIMEALQARFAATAGIPAILTRRNASPSTIATPNNPAMVLVKRHETYHRTSESLPPRRTMTVLGIVYVDTGSDPNGIPDAVLNPIQYAIDAALAPDSLQTNLCTLGGLVYAVIIRGELMNAPGDPTGKGIAIVPIDIIIP